MRRNIFEERIKPILKYVGAIGAILASIVYIIAVIVLIQGFKFQQPVQTIVFAAINAIIGFIILQLLKVQGLDFAKELEENKKIREEYYKTKTKDKKLRSMKFYWIKTTIMDIFFKCLMFGLVTAGLIYIVIHGSHDYNLLLLAFANLILFICFGLLALNSAYSFYNEYQIPYMEEKIKEVKDDKDRKQNISES